jgi:hypothetical protein
MSIAYPVSQIDVNQLKKNYSVANTHTKNVTPANLIEQTIASISEYPQIRNILKKFSPEQIEKFIKESNCKNHEGVVRVIKGLYERHKDELTDLTSSVCFYQPKITAKDKNELVRFNPSAETQEEKQQRNILASA